MTLQVWELITGSSNGGVSDRQMAVDIITTAALFDVDEKTILNAWRELATTDDEDIDTDDYVDLLDGLAPTSCSIHFDDNELRVRPFIDEEYPKVDELPESGMVNDSDVVYVVNDHGNVTCYKWDGEAYQFVWDMV